MSGDDFEDFDPFADDDDDVPTGGSGAAGAGEERIESEWEELDWEELDYEDLGYEPEDADRVREAWRRINAGYGRRPDLPGLLRIFETFSDVAGDSVSPETRRAFERVLRDLLIIIRDVIDRAIERLEEQGKETEIEEIPID